MTNFQQERAYCAALGQKTLAKLKLAESMKYSRKPSKIPVKPMKSQVSTVHRFKIYEPNKLQKIFADLDKVLSLVR